VAAPPWGLSPARVFTRGWAPPSNDLAVALLAPSPRRRPRKAWLHLRQLGFFLPRDVQRTAGGGDSGR
jgi:hypothetical protein